MSKQARFHVSHPDKMLLVFDSVFPRGRFGGEWQAGIFDGHESDERCECRKDPTRPCGLSTLLD
jgi:hypothetical protein